VNFTEAMARVAKEFPFPGDVRSDPVYYHGKYSSIAETVLKYVSIGGRILDFGCGPCDKTAVLQHLGYVCSGCDDLNDDWHQIPENRQKILNFINHSGIDFKTVNDASLPFSKHSFEMVMLHDVLEHLHESPRELLNSLLEKVVPGGLLFITVPNAVNIRKRLAVLLGKTNMPPFSSFFWYPGFWRGHVREYVKSDLAQLAEFLGLDVLELRGCDHMLDRVPAVFRRFYLILTSVFHGWKDTWLLVARKKPDWKPIQPLSSEEREKMFGPVVSG